MKFAIKYALGGGFGGLSMDAELHDFDNLKEAEEYAYQMAVEEYESYGGLHGLTTIDEMMEENGITDEDEGLELYFQEIESCLCYEAVEIKE